MGRGTEQVEEQLAQLLQDVKRTDGGPVRVARMDADTTKAKGSLEAQLAGIIDVDLDPSRQRIVLDAGGNDGVRVGQAMIDAGGVLGQVIEVTPRHSTALLLTDPEHAVPVQVARTGLRAIYLTPRTIGLSASYRF